MVLDHGTVLRMDTMSISQFKATCLAALSRVARTGRTLRVTRFGKPIADIVPPAPADPSPAWMGGMRGTLRAKGDLIAPVVDLSEWEILGK